MKRQDKEKLQNILNRTYPDCWMCGGKSDTKHHFPPKALRPKMTIKIPLCRGCHNKIDETTNFREGEIKSLRMNIRKIERSVKNIRRKLLDKRPQNPQNDAKDGFQATG